MGKSWIIFDLDGTLADITHRLHHITPPQFYIDGFSKEKWSPNWDAFNEACHKDKLKFEIASLLRIFYGKKQIAIFTGRMENVRELTESWLLLNDLNYDLLEMRAEKDYRNDTEVKKEMFEKHFLPEDVLFIVDDRDKVIEMWRSLGLTCLQCQKGDY